MPTEHEECKRLMEWAYVRTWNGWRLSELLAHIPNGAFHGADRKAGAVIARKLREEGLQPGVFDYILPIPKLALGIPGLWLEMKRTKRGEVSEDQVKFQGRMEQLGWKCAIAKGWEEAARIIEDYIKMGNKPCLSGFHPMITKSRST